MEVATLIIAVLALVIAVIAFQRTGGIQDLRRQVEALRSKQVEVFGSKSGTVRDRTADALERLERLIRGKEKTSPEGEKETESDEPPRRDSP
jgi:hypothetical protein